MSGDDNGFFLGVILLAIMFPALMFALVNLDEDEEPPTHATFALTNDYYYTLEVAITDHHVFKLSNGHEGRTYYNVSVGETLEVDVECYKDYGNWSRYDVNWVDGNWYADTVYSERVYPEPGERYEVSMTVSEYD